jgi:hypothetical protein
MDTDQALQNQSLDHIRELLTTHWREAKDSADDDGKFESQVDDPGRMKLL